MRAGKDGHNLKKCPQPLVDGGLRYAVCFICNGTGHVAGKCSQNPNGIYPKGGACKVCGDKFHLAKDCPEKGTKKDKKAMADASATPGLISSQKLNDPENILGNAEYEFKGKSTADALSSASEQGAKTPSKAKTKAKVVKF